MKGWRHEALAELVSEAKPGFASGQDDPEGVLQIRMNNVTPDGRLDFSRERRVPTSSQRLESYLLQPGDVLFNATNSPSLVGKSAYFAGHSEPVVMSNHFLRLRPRPDRADGRYLARWLNLQFQRGRFEGISRQWVNQATVGRDRLLSMTLPTPPVEEQRRIAQVLDRAEALRAKRRALLAQLDSVADAIFVDMFGDPLRNARGFSVSLMGHVCDVRDGTHDSPKYVDDGGFPLVTSKNLSSGFLDLEGAGRISEHDYVQINRRSKVKRGDIIMPMIGTIGSPVLVEEEPCFAIKNVALIKFGPSSPSAVFVRHLLSAPYFDQVSAKANRGGTQKFLSLGDLRALPLPIPPTALQQDFARRVAAIEKLKTAHRASLAELDALFASLQHRAFRGEL